MKADELERQINRVFQALHADLGDEADAEHITAVGRFHYESLAREATINDFIPLLVYRYAKEELIHIRRGELHHAA